MHHVIIGSGPAGVTAAETLRKLDPAAEITVLCGEGEPPYARMAIPYLLKGDIGEAGTYIRKDADHYARLRIGLLHAPRRGGGHRRPHASRSATAAASPTTAC